MFACVGCCDRICSVLISCYGSEMEDQPLIFTTVSRRTFCTRCEGKWRRITTLVQLVRQPRLPSYVACLANYVWSANLGGYLPLPFFAGVMLVQLFTPTPCTFSVGPLT